MTDKDKLTGRNTDKSDGHVCNRDTGHTKINESKEHIQRDSLGRAHDKKQTDTTNSTGPKKN